MTTRGFGVEQARQLAGWICDIIGQLGDEQVEARVKEQVLELCRRFPVYQR